jgi:hypothetical protein
LTACSFSFLSFYNNFPSYYRKLIFNLKHLLVSSDFIFGADEQLGLLAGQLPISFLVLKSNLVFWLASSCFISDAVKATWKVSWSAPASSNLLLGLLQLPSSRSLTAQFFFIFSPFFDRMGKLGRIIISKITVFS